MKNLPCKCGHSWKEHVNTWFEVFGTQGEPQVGDGMKIYLDCYCKKKCGCKAYKEMNNLEYCEYMAQFGGGLPQ